MSVKKVGILTAGGLAPCLSSAVGGLIERYSEIAPDVEILCYLSGYKGLLLGDSIAVTPAIRKKAAVLHQFGGSPIGNSRVKLTNLKDCLKRGLVQEGQAPQKVAADQLVKDGIDILHTIGGDDTNTAAADLAAFLRQNDYDLTVIGLPKTIDNDVIPIRQSLGAWTAAEQGARYFQNVVLIEHRELLAGIGLSKERLDVHGIFIPEMGINIEAEAKRLKGVMDEVDNVNIFISEGAGVTDIVKELETAGQDVPRDAFGHVKLDAVNPGVWFGKQFGAMLGAEKTLVQKSGYFSRAAPANRDDLRLIKSCTDLAVECALRREGGVMGHDEEQGDVLRAIEFERIKGGKAFDLDIPWFGDLLGAIGQTKGPKVETAH